MATTPNPYERRLAAEYEKVKKLVNGSGGTLKLISAVPNPPTQYEIEYHCPSLVIDRANRVSIGHTHRVQYRLGSEYPFKKGSFSAVLLTPIFNPHIYTFNNAICFGSFWSIAETLDLWILKVGRLLQLDPQILDEHSPANVSANQWVRENRDKIPLGRVSFQAPKKPASRIEWT